MTLIDAVRNLESLNDEDTIYAAEPWTGLSSAIVADQPDDGGVPAEARMHSLKYFLEVFVAREVLEGWMSGLAKPPTIHETLERLVAYALDDA